MQQDRLFGALLRRLREDAGVRLTRLAIEMEMSATYLSDVERGTRPPLGPDRIRFVANRLELTGEQAQQLHAAAGASRGSIELAVDLPESARTLAAAALANVWSGLDAAKLGRLEWFVRDLAGER